MKRFLLCALLCAPIASGHAADVAAPPQIMGFVASDPQIGAYFGAHIFAESF